MECPDCGNEKACVCLNCKDDPGDATIAELERAVRERDRLLQIVRDAINDKSDIYHANEKLAPYNDDAHISDITLTARDCKDINAALEAARRTNG